MAIWKMCNLGTCKRELSKDCEDIEPADAVFLWLFMKKDSLGEIEFPCNTQLLFLCYVDFLWHVHNRQWVSLIRCFRKDIHGRETQFRSHPGQ